MKRKHVIAVGISFFLLGGLGDAARASTPSGRPSGLSGNVPTQGKPLQATQSQEGDLIKERITLAPRQKNALEKYDAPGADKATPAASNAKEAASNNNDKPARHSRDNSEGHKVGNDDKATVTANAYPTPVADWAGSSSARTSAPPSVEPVTNAPVIERGFDNLFNNPDKFLSRGFEILVIGGVVLLGLYFVMQKFRSASSK
jgi:hypothetical protein